MRSNWLSPRDLDGGTPFVLPTEPFLLHSFGGHICSRISNFVDTSAQPSRHVIGKNSLQETYSRIFSYANSIVFWFTSGPRSDVRRRIVEHLCNSKYACCKFSSIVRQIISAGSVKESMRPEVFNIRSFMMRYLGREAEKLQSLPLLSVSGILVPPSGNLSSKIIDGPLEGADMKMLGSLDQRLSEVETQGCSARYFSDYPRKRHTTEPRTGIEFPMVLNSNVAGERNSNLTSEILVGTGSRTMKIVKIKSLRLYAFGFYVHPDSICRKLGPKYASISSSDLNKCHSFYEDLLREDIGMTVRLVVNCSGMKINAVKDAFEKSLRKRLLKTNPNTDGHCLSEFGSMFQRDIPLPVGTTIDFHRTADGNLITEIGGNKIGAVQSKDLCRAFFDMYIGDPPVSEQTKDEIGKNVAGLMKRC